MENIINYYKQYWLNYVKFDGRARRSEYWYPVLCNAIIAFVLGLLANVVGIFSVVAWLFSVANILPGLGVAIRRLHDVGKCGWWLLIGLVPLVGEILLLVWACTDSNPGENQYGPNPKA